MPQLTVASSRNDKGATPEPSPLFHSHTANDGDLRQKAIPGGALQRLEAPSVSGEQETVPLTEDIIKAIAKDIGKEVVDYVERMYPKAVEATTSTFRLSLRNCIYNEIMAAIQVNDEGKILARLDYRKKFRQHLKKLKKAQNVDQLRKAISESPKNPAEDW